MPDLEEKPSAAAFEQQALALFREQARQNALYRDFITHLRVQPERVQRLEDLPFLPIRFFKSHAVKSVPFRAEKIFRSSGTTGQTRSAHHVPSLLAYQQHSQALFEQQYGPLSEWVVLALLPSYLEQGASSLVFMVEHFVRQTGHPLSGFYLHEPQALRQALAQAAGSGRKVLLIGVAFALLDAAEWGDLPRVPQLTVMETGGMKGRRAEITRPELHQALMAGFGVSGIHSEYGMTELLSQAYAPAAGRFHCSASMAVLLRDINDPLTRTRQPGRGGLNLIDLANTHSCAFIETEDQGALHADGTFEVLGRLDNSDVRGCSLMI